MFVGHRSHLVLAGGLGKSRAIAGVRDYAPYSGALRASAIMDVGLAQEVAFTSGGVDVTSLSYHMTAKACRGFAERP
ncbi:hypothetical protein BOSEA31B_12438 [Hyphomicrobiales bacterium]|nr:hypothetical protein BOSEA31B_12438 [Hyphomicrobiales bacterium]CAI0347861.1 hypothetical protein BO1005MUT1_90222 [Hyphomicrobiales bacterium]